jgi:hypothetical protein
MADFSLVPVDHQPDFADASLVPVDHDPFSAEGTVQQAQTQPASPPTTGAGQPNLGAPAAIESVPGGSQRGNDPNPNGGNAGGHPNPTSDQGGSSEPVPFGGYANPTPTESLINRAKMEEQAEVIKRDQKAGRIIDGGERYRFVTTRQPIAHYLIDGLTGTVFTEISPFYAYDGTRYAIIDASPERPVTVTVPEDGKFKISRP